MSESVIQTLCGTVVHICVFSWAQKFDVWSNILSLTSYGVSLWRLKRIISLQALLTFPLGLAFLNTLKIKKHKKTSE